MDYFVFDDIDTRDYEGIYVFPGKVDNTPKRVYETKNIVGREGALYIDQGRYEDVAQTYSIAALTKQVGSEFINALASKVGYFRLSDSFNPTEFYSAVFTSGAEVKIEKEREKNVFSITFTRKPQRWLVSGETAITVEDGGEIENLTKFDSEPLLAVDGYGTIDFNGYEIEIENVPIGEVIIATNVSGYGAFDFSTLNTSDTIKITGVRTAFRVKSTSANVSLTQYDTETNCAVSLTSSTATFDANTISFVKGTSGTFTYSANVKVRVTAEHQTTNTTVAVSWTFSYDGNSTISISHTFTPSTVANVDSMTSLVYPTATITGNSTKSAISDTVYIDCDIGECWTIQNGNIVSLNGVISLGSDLPKLSIGTNTFTYDNTVTELNVTPRWWKV